MESRYKGQGKPYDKEKPTLKTPTTCITLVNDKMKPGEYKKAYWSDPNEANPQPSEE